MMTQSRLFLEQYGSRGAQMIIRKIVQDWLDLEVNADPSNPLIDVAHEITQEILPKMSEMLDELANRE